jgi:hypothetical protein
MFQSLLTISVLVWQVLTRKMLRWLWLGRWFELTSMHCANKVATFMLLYREILNLPCDHVFSEPSTNFQLTLVNVWLEFTDKD